ncbi:MAG: sugar phosphate isomerase/epimerase [Planctomycetes bacterium]|nr:sugar phosphate isomerase/epimerase [Planctomycetota bacterium]
MKFGMNLLLWTGDLSDSILPTLEMLKKIGYDGVEIPIFAPDEKKFALWGKRLDELGLKRTAVTIRLEADNPISPDPKVRAAGIAATKATLDSCKAAGVESLIGPYHSALGFFSGAGPTPDEWKWGVEGMRQVAEYAGKLGVMLGVEPLNRFETYLLNSAVDGARFVREVGHPNCRLMYDTFHANIEEKNVTAAVKSCADVLVHVHISENDRSTPGAGDIRWDETFDALKAVNYDGWMTVEAFGLALPEIAAATKIWRRMYQSEEQLATDALAFIKKQVAQRWK